MHSIVEQEYKAKMITGAAIRTMDSMTKEQ